MKNFCLGFLVCVLIFATNLLFGQIDVKGKIKDKSIQRADDRTDQGIDKGLDGIENGVKNVFKKKDKDDKKDKNKDDKKNNNDNNDQKDDADNDNGNSSGGNSSSNPKKNKIYTVNTKYDFIPGEKVLFYDDFSQDLVNEYPLGWLTNGASEIVKLDDFPGINWFYMKGEVSNCIENHIAFTENTTFECDFIPYNPSGEGCNEITIRFWEEGAEPAGVGDLVPGKGGYMIKIKTDEIELGNWKDGTYSVGGGTAATTEIKNNINEKIHLAVWQQKRRVRVYINQEKVIDLPQVVPAGLNINKIDVFNDAYYEEGKLFMSNFRVAVGAPDMRSKLLTDGKFSTTGIKFDSGKDVLKPESYSIIKEIAQVLKDNPAVNIKIVGHTDSDGDDNSNLSLSKKRADAVKKSLEKDFGIDAARMQTDGKGESQPVGDNKTAQGKAENRRVEFIKL